MNEKHVYSIDPGTLGQKKTVAAAYSINMIYETEQEPPKDVLILAWDNKARAWYDAGSNTEVRLINLEMALVEVFEKNIELEAKIEALEGNTEGTE